ncbi:MAG: hypothetical protein KDD51_05835 [Bdellovibrionales bacterium]|nr:hypothetical protein [Bdellovibrionales bacterium]
MNHTLKWLVALACFSVAVAFGDPPTGKYKRIVDDLAQVQNSFPAYASVFSIGQNDDGTEIYALRVSATPQRMDGAKIGHLMVGTHHGNESHAPLFVVRFINHLVKRFSTDALWKDGLADHEWTFIPVLNISGYNSSSRYEKGVDPNRDYPGPCNPNPGGKLQSIRTLMSFLSQRQFSGAVTVHGYIGTMTYPWGVDTDTVETLDHNLFAQITAKAAEFNGYRHGTHTDIVYPATGTFEDFSYWKYGMWALLLELKSGSNQDLDDSVLAIESYYSQLAATPSTHFDFLGKCLRARSIDLQLD